MEFMGLYLSGISFVMLNMELCDVLIIESVCWVLLLSVLGNNYMLVCEVFDEKVFVNGIVGFMVIGGFMNFLIYLFVMVWVGGIILDW